MKVPFLSTPDKTITSTTQDFLPIADVADNIVVYKHGGAALIMSSTSLNFGLLSEREQDAKIASYAGLLNSIKFPVQIVVRSQKKDISIYMKYLESHEKNVTNEKLAIVMQDYKQFVVDSIKKKNVLSKTFYMVVPFTPYELGVTKSVASTVSPLQRNKPLPFPRSYVIRKAKIALLPKRDHLARQARRLGVELRQLTTEELIQLFYNVYNPEPPVKEQEVFG